MKKLLFPAFLLLISPTLTGQGIPKHEADSLGKVIAGSKSNKARLDILFKLSQYHILKPGEKQADLDSAKAYIDQAINLNRKVRSEEAEGILVFIGSLLARERGQTKEAKDMAGRAVAMLKDGKDHYYLGKAYYMLAEYYDYNNPDESEEKIRLVDLAVKSFQKTDDIQLQAFSLTFLADLYQLKNEKKTALQKLDTALQLYQSIDYKELQGVYALYSTIYYGDKLFRQALNSSLMALKYAKSNGDTSMTLCQINNYVGMSFLQAKQFESAVPYFQEALKIAEKYGDKSAALALMMNIIQSYIDLKKAGEALIFLESFSARLSLQETDVNYVQKPLAYLLIYTELKRYAEGRQYVNEILQLINRTNINSRVLSNLYYMITKYYLESGQYKNARIYGNKLDSTSALSGSAVRRRGNLQLQFRLDSALGNYRSAFTNLLTYHKLYDSLFNESSRNDIKQLEIEYETEKNKNEIAALNQKNEKAQNKLDRDKLVRKFTIGGIILLFIILALLYRQYRNKQKSNKIILQKNNQLEHLVTEKEWLVKEIHHRVKNNFHIVSSLLEIQSSYLKNTEALSAIKESQHRIHSMSIIHQKLYQTENLSTIHMPEYIYELVEYLRDSYAIRDTIGFSLQIENIALNHASAITLGLILNEAITNAIKYAFGGTEEKKISISLTHISETQILLSIADNGSGLPVDFDSRIGASMGMELLQGLTDDLGGSFSIETDNGTLIKVIFDYKPVHAGNVSFS